MQVHRRIVMWKSLASVMLFAILSFSLVAATAQETSRSGEQQPGKFLVTVAASTREFTRKVEGDELGHSVISHPPPCRLIAVSIPPMCRRRQQKV